MPRLKIKKLTVRQPPRTVAERVVLKKPPRLQEVSLVDRAADPHGVRPPVVHIIKKPPAIANVIKAPPKPKIAAQAAAKTPDIAARIANRERYRENAGVIMDSCEENLAHLADMATMHHVTFPNGSVREIPAFTLTALGEPLKTSGATVTRWVKRDMLPEPFLETSRGKVYHIEEARSFVRIIGAHQREFRQYRDEHEDVKDRIFKENAAIRRGLFSPK